MGWENDRLPTSLAEQSHVLSEKRLAEAGSAVCSILTSLISCSITHGAVPRLVRVIQSQELHKYMLQSSNTLLLFFLQPLLGGLAWPSDERSGGAR